MMGRTGWMLRRLLLMSPAEVAFRLAARTRMEWEQLRLPRLPPAVGPGRGRDEPFVPNAAWSYLADRTSVVSTVRNGHHWDPSAAERFLHHEFSFFALAKLNAGASIAWNRDYQSGIDAPMRYGPTLDYRNQRLCGDIKYAWELNRHHHLVELAKATYLTGDTRYEAELLHQVGAWIQACPYPYGINWSSSLESGLRVINWCFCLHLLHHANPDFASRNEEALKRWIASVHDHLSFINRHFSRYSSANNHLIGEAVGLLVGALCFPFPESPEWASRAQNILTVECDKQNWSDGVNKEQTLSYQAFVFDFLLVAGLVARGAGRDFTPSYWQRLERMAEFVAALIDERGNVPHIGDEDDGYVMVLSHHPEFKLHRSLLATAAALFGRGDFRGKARHFDEKSFWLLGPAGASGFAAASHFEPARSVFPEGGYVVLRGAEARVVFDCGPLGYLSLAAHGHADALSVLLEYRGWEFLVDPGTYAYHTKREWRDYFRGTSAHNTVRIDRRNQSEIGGNFMWLTKARCTLKEHAAHNVTAEHDGYRRLRGNVIHERRLSLDDRHRELVVEDVFRGAGSHVVEAFFHFHPECRLEDSASGVLVRRDHAAIEVVRPPGGPHPRMYHGSLDPLGGWYSPGYDRKIPSSMMVFQSDMTLPGSWKTIIRLLP
jgi:hypothetical protein